MIIWRCLLFVTERLRIRIIPTIALIKDCKTKDYIVGFTDLGNCDDFSTEMMEWRIAQAGVINYSGDLLEPPAEGKRTKNFALGGAGKKHTIRGRAADSDEDDDFWRCCCICLSGHDKTAVDLNQAVFQLIDIVSHFLLLFQFAVIWNPCIVLLACPSYRNAQLFQWDIHYKCRWCTETWQSLSYATSVGESLSEPKFHMISKSVRSDMILVRYLYERRVAIMQGSLGFIYNANSLWLWCTFSSSALSYVIYFLWKCLLVLGVNSFLHCA